VPVEFKYTVFLCRQCGFPGLITWNQQASSCRNCKSRNTVDKVKVVKRTDSQEEARATIMYVKSHRSKFLVKKEKRKV